MSRYVHISQLKQDKPLAGVFYSSSFPLRPRIWQCRLYKYLKSDPSYAQFYFRLMHPQGRKFDFMKIKTKKKKDLKGNGEGGGEQKSANHFESLMVTARGDRVTHFTVGKVALVDDI